TAEAGTLLRGRAAGLPLWRLAWWRPLRRPSGRRALRGLTGLALRGLTGLALLPRRRPTTAGVGRDWRLARHGRTPFSVTSRLRTGRLVDTPPHRPDVRRSRVPGPVPHTSRRHAPRPAGAADDQVRRRWLTASRVSSSARRLAA